MIPVMIFSQREKHLTNSIQLEGVAMSASKSFLQHFLAVNLVLVVLLVLVGCQKKEGEAAKPETAQIVAAAPITVEGLKAAYAAESKRVDWYERFSKQAQKENLGDIAVLFKALARSEKVHVDGAAALLKSKGIEVPTPTIEPVPAGKARQYLKLALSNENVEQGIYASDTVKARLEQFTEAAEWFKKALNSDARHARLLKKAIELETNFARLPYMMCPECGYIVGSDKLEECPVCKASKDKFQKI
jgi:rubrerythrin